MARPISHRGRQYVQDLRRVLHPVALRRAEAANRCGNGSGTYLARGLDMPGRRTGQT
jgi:hypothetical protein